MDLGTTKVVNAASHDNIGEPGKIALITIEENKVNVDWHFLHEVSEIWGIGSKYTRRLQKVGIKSVEDLLKMPFPQLYEKTNLGKKRLQKFIVRAQAIKDQKPYILAPLEIRNPDGGSSILFLNTAISLS